jgi:hypothetical protein
MWKSGIAPVRLPCRSDVRQKGKIRQYAAVDVLHPVLGDVRRTPMLVA